MQWVVNYWLTIVTGGPVKKAVVNRIKTVLPCGMTCNGYRARWQAGGDRIIFIVQKKTPPKTRITSLNFIS